ncbi:MAG TPA: N-acetylmuramoyl-L-alanine amidase [Rhodocyclaceae bacterium]|nr:N-acetylmuramoyl-L-alanine amidase [Rhodocyclaceae bacterium]
MRILLLLLSLLLNACASLPGERRLGSPNFDGRKPNLVVLHHTTNETAERALRTLTDPERKVSAHYLIGRDGTVYPLVDESQRAWHAGESWWAGYTDINSASIGIELDNNGDEPFAEAQIAALIPLLQQVIERHRIPPNNIIGHGDVAPGRKVDPSRHFPWRRLADAGLGLWCLQPPSAAPAGFDAQLGLAVLGYDLLRPELAIAAFRRHFLADDRDAPLNPGELALLACLVSQKTGIMLKP